MTNQCGPGAPVSMRPSIFRVVVSMTTTPPSRSLDPSTLTYSRPRPVSSARPCGACSGARSTTSTTRRVSGSMTVSCVRLPALAW
ncbi:Uncharacterised protein [Mycobacteroides abscessus subsp. abscessus]|nr:Uncharacterised protein [Mycobacteroides abscessus subsp. abscessus]